MYFVKYNSATCKEFMYNFGLATLDKIIKKITKIKRVNIFFKINVTRKEIKMYFQVRKKDRDKSIRMDLDELVFSTKYGGLKKKMS